jgi:predicted nucleotide-binding protein
MKETITAKVTEATFTAIADRHPSLWRRMAQILGAHLRESNRFLRRPNPRPRVFIASSPGGKPLAQAIAATIGDSEHELPTWLVDTGCHADASSLVSLAGDFTDSDFGVITIAPGDGGPGVDGQVASPDRDALFFECGVCLGAMGPHRTILIQPDDLDGNPFYDAIGLTPHVYRRDPIEALKADMLVICDAIRKMISQLRSR